MEFLNIAGLVFFLGILVTFFFLTTRNQKWSKKQFTDENHSSEQGKVSSIPFRTRNQNNFSGSGSGRPRRNTPSSHRGDDTSFITGVMIGSVLGGDSPSKHESPESYQRPSSDSVSFGDSGSSGGGCGGGSAGGE